MNVKNLFKKPVKRAIDRVVDDTKDKAKDAIGEVKDEIIDSANDIFPYFIVGGVILIGICLARKQPPITVKVVVKQA
jgi:uncharacterized membrane protein YraQ (UPF0718 family)